jgi:anthranilate/para-aminobenzoate synthase component II
MILVLDNSVGKDPLSFIDDIIRAFKKYNIPFLCVNKIQAIPKITGIVISGSSRVLSKEGPPDFNVHYLKIKVPVYGICFGCQLLGSMYGGKITHHPYVCGDYVTKPMMTKYHYCFSDHIQLPKCAIASIVVKGKKIDTGFVFDTHVFGTIYHPEYYEETDDMFLHFYDFCKSFKDKN